MASVKKALRSRHWLACYKVPTGKTNAAGLPLFKRVQRSTGTEDREQARQIAISFERATTAASQMRWGEVVAHRLALELSVITGIVAGQTMPLMPFLARWLASRRSSLAPNTHAMYSARIRDFSAFLGLSVNGPVSDISAQVVASWRDAQLAEGKSTGTVNLSLTIVGQAFAEAVRTGLLPRNPCSGLTIRGAKKRAQRRSAFTFDQFRALVAACDGEWRTMVLLCGYTGARRDEASKIEWRQIDLAGRRLTLERSKTADAHWLPMHASLAAHVAGLTAGDGLVMPGLAALGGREVSWLFRNTILPKIGIVQAGEKQSGKGRRLAKYSLHSLRHSLATWLNEAGVSELSRMRIVGHDDRDVSRGYTHTELDRLAAEMAKVPSVGLPITVPPAPEAPTAEG